MINVRPSKIIMGNMVENGETDWDSDVASEPNICWPANFFNLMSRYNDILFDAI